jgi:hypothetical protein
MKSLILRLSNEEHAAAQALATCRGLPVAGFLRLAINQMHDSTRAKLDSEALALFDQGRLDRIGWGKASVRHQQRKQADAEPAR